MNVGAIPCRCLSEGQTRGTYVEINQAAARESPVDCKDALARVIAHGERLFMKIALWFLDGVRDAAK
jgi:hypothetical protein